MQKENKEKPSDKQKTRVVFFLLAEKNKVPFKYG